MLIRPPFLLPLIGGMVILSSRQPMFGDGVRKNGNLKIVFLRPSILFFVFVMKALLESIITRHWPKSLLLISSRKLPI